MAKYITIEGTSTQLSFEHEESFSLVSFQNNGVPEAPIDGKQYVRKSAAWSEVDFEEIDSKIDDVEDALTTEIQRVEEGSTSRDLTLQSNIDKEEAKRVAADTILDTNITNVDGESKLRDTTLQTNIDNEESARVAADSMLEVSKENVIDYGPSGYMAIVAQDGQSFEFTSTPDFDFFRLRGLAYKYSGSEPLGIVDIEGDQSNAAIIAGKAPNDSGGNPSGIAFRLNEHVTTVIHPNETATAMESGDVIYWSGDNGVGYMLKCNPLPELQK